MFDWVLPPPEYRKPFTKPLYVEQIVDPDELNRICRRSDYPRGTRYHSCTFVKDDGSCWIVWLANADKLLPAIYLKNMWEHEIAHCHGWKHDPVRR